jgi:chemotaxis protein histidine kinase CheA
MSLNDLMIKLQKDYLDSLPTKMKTIEAHWKNDLIEELEGEFHKMKGTGLTYGMPELSLLAREMENLCAARQTDHIARAMPIALTLIEKTRLERIAGRAFDLSSDASYRRLLMLDRTKRGA